MAKFGFMVRKGRKWLKNKAGEYTERVVDPGKWSVSLPHQCDEWEIAGGDYDYVSHEEAVKELRQFIEEAKTALMYLETETEMDEE